jgi:cytoskeletal protein CcmA (bactofilin family)
VIDEVRTVRRSYDPGAVQFVRVALLVALVLALTPSHAAAADVRSGQDITIGANETIDDDLYVFGNNISILGTVRGDVIAFGQSVSIDGTISGDLIAAAGTIAIRGQVGGSVRGAAGSIALSGRVTDDLVVAGSDISVASAGRVGRDAIVAGNSAIISGQVGRDIRAGATTLRIDAPVGRDVVAQVDRLELTDRAAVEGSLTYTSANEAQIAVPGSVKGRIERIVPEATGETPVVQGPAALALDWLRGLVGLLILGLLVVFFFPGFARRSGEALVRSPLLSLAVGALVLIGLPILAILFFIIGALIGGWWIGFVVLALFIVLIALSIPVASVGVGAALLRVTQRPGPAWLALLLGLVVVLLVALVPIVGGIVIFLALLFGMGAATLAVARGRQPEAATA